MVKRSPEPTDKYVGMRARARRMMLGMSQTRLADAVGLTFQQIQKYEKGTNRISASRLQEIAKMLQVPVAYFFEGIPHMSELPKVVASSPDHIFEFLGTHDGLVLAKAFTQIRNGKLRRSIVHLVEGIAERGQN